MPQVDEQDREMARGILDNRSPLSEPDFGDSSWPLFTMYSKLVEEEDNDMAERWERDAQGIIIFTGLFSAVVATMIAISIQDLRPDSQDASAFYLKQLYLLQTNPNTSIPSSTPSIISPPAFSAPWYAVCVNTLWFLSLVISLTCAMLATSVQQWARRYIKATQPVRCSPHKRARERAFFANGIGRSHVPLVVEQLPALVHLSLFLFFAGLLVYIFHINDLVFASIAFLIALLLSAYFYLTLIPIFWLDSPYNMPFSGGGWALLVAFGVQSYTGPTSVIGGVLTYLIILLCWIIFRYKFSDIVKFVAGKCFRNWITRDMESQVEEMISRRSSEFDIQVLDLTLDAAREDNAREEFFEYLPGFYKSDLVKDFRQRLPNNVQSKIHCTLVKFIRRTLLSNTLSKSVKFRRLAICIAAADEMAAPAGSEYTFGMTIYENWHFIPHSVEFAEFLKSWDKGRKGRYSQWIVSSLVANVLVHERNEEHCISLAMDHMGVPRNVLQDYINHGDSLLLATLIHSTRHAVQSNFSSFFLLPPLSVVHISGTLPGLQRDFCTLWNTLAQTARYSRDPEVSVCLLKALRHVYLALHHNTDSAPTAFSASTEWDDDVLRQPSSYPFCNILSYRLDLTPYVHDASTGEISHSSATASMTVPFLPAFGVHSASATPGQPGSSLYASLGDLPASNIRSFHAASQATLPNPSAPVDPVATTSTSTQTTTNHPILRSETLHDRLPPAETSVVDVPRHNMDHHSMVYLSTAPVSPILPSLTSHSGDAFSTKLQPWSTSVTAPQLNQSPAVPESPPNPSTTLFLTDHQDASILYHNIAPGATDVGPSDDSQDANPPTPTVTPHYEHLGESDPKMSREHLSCPLGAVLSRNNRSPEGVDNPSSHGPLVTP